MICDKLFLLKIICPWGDSIFINRFGSIFQQNLNYYEIDMINANNYSKVIWAKIDFLLDGNINAQ